MALGASKISALSGPSLSAAAATARPLSGGRGIASAAQSEVEGASFSGQVGVSENSILHNDNGFDPNGQRRDNPQQGAPFTSNASFAFPVTDTNSEPTAASFRDTVMYGLGVYEYNMKVITPSAVKPGSVVNHLY